MKQTRLGSLIESVMNTLIGFIISFVAWPIAAVIFNMPYTHGQHFGIVLFFTMLSVARGYIIRRWFNDRLHRAAMNIASKTVH